jgi:hypothetical protein
MKSRTHGPSRAQAWNDFDNVIGGDGWVQTSAVFIVSG